MEIKANQSQSEKQYFIILKKVHVNPSNGKEIIEWEKVEATKEQFNDYYRPINAYRKRMQSHGRCICPASKRLTCNMDCWSCPYHTTGDEPFSLDETVTGEDGSEMSAYETIPSGEDIEADYILKEECSRLRKRIEELKPLAITIGELRLEGLSDSAISERIGVPRTTFLSQLKKLKDALQDDFPDWIR